ncbi:MAG: glycerophosphodiester phosphodiesterase [Phocaeicola sp.]|uniref:glycerophosphodiester phosphodiesterase n=1 Tax=Phocaeicola sp. TaxID=2773926 RepID=UPI003FA1220A
MKKFLFTLAVALLFSATAFCQTKVIAHRGYWDTTGSYENTISSIQNAGNLGIFGSELDVYITTDDVLVVHHDAAVQGHKIDESSYEKDLKDIILPNGEKLPTLESYLREGKKFPHLKVVVELKNHTRWVDQDRCVLAVVDLVRKLHMQNQVDYISFNMNMCKGLIQLEPSADVYYLNGETSPADLKTLGFAGLDYEQGVMAKHPEWIKEAHDLGLKVNVWTVNESEKIQWFIEQGVDFITTNNPVEAKKLVEKKR